MNISKLTIKNYKSIQMMEITQVSDVLILVGRNNSGKSIILDAIRVVTGDCHISASDFHSPEGNIIIGMTLELSHDDMKYLHKNGIVGKYKQFDLWKKNFCQKLPAFKENEFGGGILEFEYVYGRDGIERYRDGFKKNNNYIKSILPKIYFIDQKSR